MTSEQASKYPVTAKLLNKIWLTTNLHPFGFSVGDNGRPSMNIRISESSLVESVSINERIEFLRESFNRMVEMGFTPQSDAGFPEGFITQTQARGVLWFWIAA